MSTDVIANFALQSGLIAFLVLLLLMLQIGVMRIFSYQRQKKRKRLIQVWRPIMTRVALGEEIDLPVLHKGDRYFVAQEWNKLFGSLRGESRQNLIEFAWRLKLHQFVTSLLSGHSNKMKLFAMVTLGHMRATLAWADLVHIMHRTRATISLVAAQALIQINAERALRQIIPLMNRRSDWHWAGIAHILKLSDREYVCRVLDNLISQAPVNRQPGLLRLLDAVHCDSISAMITELLFTTDNDRVASTCLHIVQDPKAVPVIRKYIMSPRWHVRMHAATALGRLGQPDDKQLLIDCLSDEEWWVRYRSAQALAAMPFVNFEYLIELAEKTRDRYARDILRQVISEHQDYAT